MDGFKSLSGPPNVNGNAFEGGPVLFGKETLVVSSRRDAAKEPKSTSLVPLGLRRIVGLLMKNGRRTQGMTGRAVLCCDVLY